MAGAAVPLGGATQRLLPEGVPVRFFGTAVVSHILAWLAIALHAEEFPRFVGGIGPGLATVHVLTIGVLTMTAMGASLQMLPVALGGSAPSSRVCNVIFVAVLVGGIGVIMGMAMLETRLLLVGACLLAIGIITYGITIACLLARASMPSGLIHHVWAGIGALTLAVGLAVALAVNYNHGFITDPQAWALLPVTLVLGLALAFGVAPDGTPALFGFALLFGWLLTFLVAVLQRVMPFLASMHLLRKGKRSVAPSKLVPDRPITVHRWCHFAALALITAGLALSWLPLIRVGAVIGGVGVVAFACFAATVLLRTRAHLAASVATQESRVS